MVFSHKPLINENVVKRLISAVLSKIGLFHVLVSKTSISKLDLADGYLNSFPSNSTQCIKSENFVFECFHTMPVVGHLTLITSCMTI